MFGDPVEWPDQDLVGLSSNMSVDMVLLGYVSGLFPMPLDDEIGWFSPLRRGLLPLDGLKITKSLRSASRRYAITINAAFGQVLTGCADPQREFGWIDDEIAEVYTELHGLGLVHSVECWTPGGDLAGGLYGVSVGGLFAGESMFHHPEIGRDASKVALAYLVEALNRSPIGEGGEGSAGGRILDVQWQTDHLARLGAGEVAREDYLARLRPCLDLAAPDWVALAENPPKPENFRGDGLGGWRTPLTPSTSLATPPEEGSRRPVR